MKILKSAVAAMAVLMCAILATESAFARGPRTQVGIYVGVPLVGFGFHSYYSPYYHPPYGYYPNYYPNYYPPYYPSPVVVQQQAPVYVEQNPQPAPAVQPPSSNYWYYCADSRAYYPYVRECPAGWQRVAPQPS